MSTERNRELFNTITIRNDVKLEEYLDSGFNDSINHFRTATTRDRTVNGQVYPAVYLDENDYGGLSIYFDEAQSLSLIVNLEFYYVYGFYYDGTVYAYKGEAYDALQNYGFDCIKIPFGDSYPDIEKRLTTKQVDELKASQATWKLLHSSISTLADQSIAFEDKCLEILVVFWSLIEGIRFAEISDAINNTINGSGTSLTYADFYNLADHWAKLSVSAADNGKLDPRIAVYELHHIKD